MSHPGTPVDGPDRVDGRKFPERPPFRRQCQHRLWARVRLKDGEHLFVLWDRLAFENTLIDLVDLPHCVCEEVTGRLDLPGWHPFAANSGRTESTRRTSALQHTRLALISVRLARREFRALSNRSLTDFSKFFHWRQPSTSCFKAVRPAERSIQRVESHSRLMSVG